MADIFYHMCPLHKDGMCEHVSIIAAVYSPAGIQPDVIAIAIAVALVCVCVVIVVVVLAVVCRARNRYRANTH